MAGTVTITTDTQGKVKTLTATCTASASDGTFPTQNIPWIAGTLIAFQTNPGSPAPTDNYDVTLVDQDGLDRLGGAGVDRDTSNSERVSLNAAVAPNDTLTLTIANNSVHSAVLVITLYFTDEALASTISGTVAATQSGTWTVQPGNTQNTTPWLTGSSIVKGGPITLTLDTSAYASGDCLHTAIMTFTGMARANGTSGLITKLVVMEKKDSSQQAAGELWLFDTAVTPATANNAHSVSDADRAHCVGVIPFGPYYADALGAISVNASVRLAYKTDAADTSLYGIAVTRGTPTYGASDLVFTLLAALD